MPTLHCKMPNCSYSGRGKSMGLALQKMRKHYRKQHPMALSRRISNGRKRNAMLHNPTQGSKGIQIQEPYGGFLEAIGATKRVNGHVINPEGIAKIAELIVQIVSVAKYA